VFSFVFTSSGDPPFFIFSPGASRRLSTAKKNNPAQFCRIEQINQLFKENQKQNNRNSRLLNKYAFSWARLATKR
jgi:hypothetical protein